MKPSPPLAELQRKALRFAAYRERSTAEVFRKLHELGASPADAAHVLVTLQGEGFVDDARFAGVYTRSKLRQNGWGRVKIRAGLHAAGVPGAIAEAAMAEHLPEVGYMEVLHKAAQAKWALLANETNPENRQQKLMRFLQQRGFTVGEAISAVQWLKEAE